MGKNKEKENGTQCMRILEHESLAITYMFFIVIIFYFDFGYASVCKQT